MVRKVVTMDTDRQKGRYHGHRQTERLPKAVVANKGCRLIYRQTERLLLKAIFTERLLLKAVFTIKSCYRGQRWSERLLTWIQMVRKVVTMVTDRQKGCF